MLQIYQLPNGVTPIDACVSLKRKFGIDSASSLLTASESVQHHWAYLGCSEKVFGGISAVDKGASSSTERTIKRGESVVSLVSPHTGDAEEVSDGVDGANAGIKAGTDGIRRRDPPAGETVYEETEVMGDRRELAHVGAAGGAAAGIGGAGGGVTAAMRCKKMKEKYKVVVGRSWGELPLEMQK
jgi:hypothetical protein